MACIIWSNVNNKYMQNMACIIWLMSIINKYAEYGLYYLGNLHNTIYAEYGLYYIANVNNKYMQNMVCIIWLMAIINICRIWLVLSG